MKDFERSVIDAVEYCLRVSSGFRTADEIIAGLNSGNSIVNSRLRQFIAKEVAAFLTDKYGETIRALRLYGSTAEFNAGTFSDIDLVILVKDMPEDFERTIKEMDAAISGAYFSLLGKEEDEWSYILDMHIINEDPSDQKHASKAYLEHIFLNESVAV